ncbi:MAG: zinc ABC transporter substrate-binding protein [Proteobacteria bacterium]|nr:zinc ABC transporter substrate-binding protein [Pseudomonadota bacterium]MDA0994373.1 zinc ABC transporter substrate-binding protein [Pseudomonadota bacterium]
MNRIISLALLLVVPHAANALNVFACEPEWGALVTELGPPDVELTVATTAFQDPHSLQAKPSLIAAVRSADLVVCSGADLEIGWLPLLLRRAGNRQIQVGAPGHFLAAEYVRRLEVPKVIDRSQGDVHPQGNPHIHLHPRNISRVADALTERLIEIDPDNTALYRTRLDDFQRRWNQAAEEWEERVLALNGLRFASHHRSFSYLADWLRLDIVATLESKPGIPPSGAQLATLLEQLTPDPPVGVIRTPYENEKPSRWLSGRLDIPEIMLPFTVGGRDDVIDLFTLYDVTLHMLEQRAP